MIGHYLMFNRNCEEALSVYEKAFNTKVIMMQKYKDMPTNPNFPIAEGDLNLVLHARFAIDGTEIMCADGRYTPVYGNNMFITFTTGNMELVKQAWEILKVDGNIYMELNPTFFAKLHGHLQDKYGVNWMFSVE